MFTAVSALGNFPLMYSIPTAGKRYFQQTKLADIIDAYPYKAGLSDADQLEQRKAREAFFDFLWGILVRPACCRALVPVSAAHDSIPELTCNGAQEPASSFTNIVYESHC